MCILVIGGAGCGAPLAPRGSCDSAALRAAACAQQAHLLADPEAYRHLLARHALQTSDAAVAGQQCGGGGRPGGSSGGGAFWARRQRGDDLLLPRDQRKAHALPAARCGAQITARRVLLRCELQLRDGAARSGACRPWQRRLRCASMSALPRCRADVQRGCAGSAGGRMLEQAVVSRARPDAAIGVALGRQRNGRIVGAALGWRLQSSCSVAAPWAVATAACLLLSCASPLHTHNPLHQHHLNALRSCIAARSPAAATLGRRRRPTYRRAAAAIDAAGCSSGLHPAAWPAGMCSGGSGSRAAGGAAPTRRGAAACTRAARQQQLQHRQRKQQHRHNEQQQRQRQEREGRAAGQRPAAPGAACAAVHGLARRGRGGIQ